MSFHSNLVADSVLPANLRTLLSLSGDGVHVGRRLQQVPRPGTLDVAVVRGPVESVSSSGFEVLRRHRYTLEVRYHQGNPGPAGTGKAEQDSLEAQLRTVVDAYDGTRTHAGDTTGLRGWSATEGEVDQDPGNRAVLRGSVELAALVDAGE